MIVRANVVQLENRVIDTQEWEWEGDL